MSMININELFADQKQKEKHKEEIYDNVDIFEKETEKDKGYLEIMERETRNTEQNKNDYMTNDYNISEENNVLTEPIVTEPIVTEPVLTEPVLTEPVLEVSDVSEERDKISDIFTSDKLIKIDKNKDETDTLDNFYEDLKGMSNNSNTNTNTESYSLFN